MTFPVLRPELLEAREVPAVVGGLDPSFGAAGVATASLGGTETAAAVAVQPDGKVVVVGTTSVNNDLALYRFNPDGTPDSSFNGTGVARFSTGGPGIPGGLDTATAVAVQPDGNIVVVGSTDVGGSVGFSVVRILANGTGFDIAFSGDGKQVVQFDLGGANADRATGVALQTDGKIVVVGSVQVSATDFDFGVVRLAADGTPDAAFDGDGRRTVAFNLGGTNDDRATGVAVAGDGSIVVGGYAEVAANVHDFAVARLSKAAGALDATFDGDGRATADFGGDDTAAAVAVRADGRVVLAGAVAAGGATDAGVAQLTAAGAADATFGTSGRLEFVFRTANSANPATGLALDSRGRVVVVGRTAATLAGPGNFGVARVLADGAALDGSFGTAFATEVDLGGDEGAAGVALDANGRVVVAGSTSQDGNIAVARLIGSVEKGERVGVGGPATGAAAVYVPTPAGTLPNTATAPLAAFGTTTADVRTAVGDYDGDGTDDTMLVTGPGVPIRVAVVSGKDNATLLVAPFAPYTEEFTGGGFVAAGDFDLDGRAELVLTPDQGGGPRVVLYGRTAAGATVVRASFLGIDDANFRGGARVAVADVDGDARPDLAVAAGFGGGPRVALFAGRTVLATPTRFVNDFFAFPGDDAVRLRNGVFVAAGDVTGDGFADLVFGGGPGGAPRVFILSGQLIASGNVAGAQAAPVANFFVANNAADRGGVRVAVADLDGDNKADVVAGSGEARPAALRAYLGKNFTTAGEPATFQDLSVFGGGALAGGVFVG
ncbi:MAG: FG-GAP-like repeat-containing protein [Gemmataceae bacterium]